MEESGAKRFNQVSSTTSFLQSFPPYPFPFALFLHRKFKATDMKENEINHKQGSSSNGGNKASKKKPHSHNSALRCTNSNMATKTCKARGRRNIGTFRPKLKTLVGDMEARVAEMHREKEEMLEILAAAGAIKLELGLLKISINQNSVDMIRVSEDVKKLAEILLLQLN